MRRSAGLVLSLALLPACSSLGSVADDADPFELVYAPDGTPAFAGQALMIESCGGGGFCHSEGIDIADRRGAPFGLDFDMRLASTTSEPNLLEVERLNRHQQLLFNNRNRVWASVDSGEMPVGGMVGEEVLGSTRVGYERVAADMTTFSPLPGLDTPEGRELLRNWLACGTPVIERTEPRIDSADNTVGVTVPACERTCVDPTWQSIYNEILEPSCATSICHSAEERASNLDLSLPAGITEAMRPAAIDAVLDRFLEAGAAVVAQPDGECGNDPLPLLDRADPTPANRNLMFQKVADAGVCESTMPLAGNPLTEQRICAMQVWFECGACIPADGNAACDTCIANRRGECGVILDGGGNPVCMNPPSCPNTPDFGDEPLPCL